MWCAWMTRASKLDQFYGQLARRLRSQYEQEKQYKDIKADMKHNYECTSGWISLVELTERELAHYSRYTDTSHQ